MITKEDLQKYSEILDFNLWQTERDYLQHLFLMILSNLSNDELVFKGGTALQKIYGLNRFSVDLDFTEYKELINISEKINKIKSNIILFGYETEVLEKKSIGKSFIFKIKGPLYKNPLSIVNLKFDISQREKILLEPHLKEIVPIYNDLHPYNLLVMDEKEILSEKIRAIFSREQPRDLYDLRFLLKKGIKININLVNEKLKYYNLKFNKKKFLQKIKNLKKQWQKELKNYIKNIPAFETIYKDITNNL